MSSRATLILGLVGMAAITGVIVWFTQIGSPEPSTIPVAPATKAEPAPAITLAHELAAPEKTERGGTVAVVPPPAQTETRKAAEPKKQAEGAVAPAQTGAIALEPVTLETTAASTELQKSIEPIQGGAAAIKQRYAGSTYAERRERADLLEAALIGGESGREDLRETFQALKAELIWLRDNMGTPPSEKPK